MPRKIENVFDEPRLCEVVRAIGASSVQGQIEFELIKLASLMSVGGNLNKAQIGFIASSLIEQYPHEAIADFKLCFERGAIGMYGEIQRMDGITIGLWFKEYLNEKYEVLENKLMKEKENIYSIPEPSSSDELAKQRLKEWRELVESNAGTKTLRQMSQEEIKEEGKLRPKQGTDYPITSKAELIKRDRHFQWITENFDARTGEKLPTWISEEDFNANLKKI